MTDKELFRAAVAIQEQSSQHAASPEIICLPEYSWNLVQRIKRDLVRARQRGWHLAAQSLLGSLNDACHSLQHELASASRNIAVQSIPRCPAIASAIYHDVRALEREFDKVDLNIKTHELTVTTDAIELDDIYLGEFEIRLDWTRIGGSAHPYRIVALDPHPSSRRDDVTHPHVQDELLCEGDGRTAIAAALAERRFYDFFLLVNQLLHNYGRGSAYIELENWSGTPCSDCATIVSDDDRNYCHSCDSNLCEECSSSCPGCDYSYCSECLHECAACGDNYCESCMERCPQCRKKFCDGCLEDGLCSTCYEELHPKEPENDSPDEVLCETVCLAGQGSEE